MARASVLIEAACDKGHNIKLDGSDISVDGHGCAGHGEDEYCYCPYPKATVEWLCPACKKNYMVELT